MRRSTPAGSAIIATTIGSTICRPRPVPRTCSDRRTLWRSLPKEVAFDKLSSEGKVDFQILRDSLVKNVWLAENTDPFGDDARVWNDYITDSVYLMLTQSTVEKSRAIRDAASRIAYIPAIVNAAKESLKNPPRVFVETAIRQNRGAIAFYERASSSWPARRQPSACWPGLQGGRRRAQGVSEVPREELLPRATGDWRLGKEKFAEEAGAGTRRRPNGGGSASWPRPRPIASAATCT